jgi:hypothetical protein
MKNILKYSLIGIVLACCSINEGYGQFVDGLNIEEINTPYIFVNPVARIGRTINLSVDFGQEQRTLDLRTTGLLDKDGKALKFNSMVQGLNYFHSYGYILDNTIVDPTGGVVYVLAKTL